MIQLISSANNPFVLDLLLSKSDAATAMTYLQNLLIPKSRQCLLKLAMVYFSLVYYSITLVTIGTYTYTINKPTPLTEH